jgi:hypothetical protein
VTQCPGPPSLSQALRSVVGAAVAAPSRTGLLTVVRPAAEDDDAPRRIVVPFPSPRVSPEARRSTGDDGPDAA